MGAKYILAFGLLVIGRVLFGAALSGNIDALFGRNLSPEQSKASLTVEPKVVLGLTEFARIGLLTSIDRPTDVFERLSVGKTVLSIDYLVPVGLFAVTPSVSSNLLNLDRWASDGYRARLTASLTASVSQTWLSASVRAGSFWMLNEFSTLANGGAASQFGFLQRADVELKINSLLLALSVIVEQSFNGVWANDYATMQQIGYQIEENAVVSLRHELLSSVIDASTGFYRPLRLSDGRDSRISLVFGLKL